MKGHVWQLIGHVILLTLSIHVVPGVRHPQQTHHHLTFSAVTPSAVTFYSSIISDTLVTFLLLICGSTTVELTRQSSASIPVALPFLKDEIWICSLGDP